MNAFTTSYTGFAGGVFTVSDSTYRMVYHVFSSGFIGALDLALYGLFRFYVLSRGFRLGAG